MVHSAKQVALEKPLLALFSKCNILIDRGINFLVDATGTLFTALVPDLKDVKCNREAWGLFQLPYNIISIFLHYVFTHSKAVCSVASCLSKSQRMAPVVLSKTILAYFAAHKMFPVGITQDIVPLVYASVCESLCVIMNIIEALM